MALNIQSLPTFGYKTVLASLTIKTYSIQVRLLLYYSYTCISVSLASFISESAANNNYNLKYCVKINQYQCKLYLRINRDVLSLYRTDSYFTDSDQHFFL